MPSGNPEHDKGQPSIGQAALFGFCPRCKDKTLFEGGARIASKCATCALDYNKLDSGGIRSGLLTLMIAVVLIALAIGLDIALTPPLWVSAAIWMPITFLAVFLGLRAAKAHSLYEVYEQMTAEAGRTE